MTRVDYQGIADAKEPELLPDGVHELRIITATFKESNAGKMMTEVMMDCPETPDAQPIYHYLTTPVTLEDYLQANPQKAKADWERSENFKALGNKRFLTHFDIPYDEGGYDTEDFVGQTAGTRTKVSDIDDQGRRRVELKLPSLTIV